jgi:hypothetical protein
MDLNLVLILVSYFNKGNKMNKSDILQDISVEISKAVKKHLQHIKELPTKDKKDIEKLIGNFKNGLDNLS